jgi:hypothetical protein
MDASLCETFPVWPADVEKRISNAENLAFFYSMKTDRAATFGSKDSILDKKIKRSNKRQQLAQKRADKEQRRVQEAGEEAATRSLLSSSSSSSDEGECDMDLETPKERKRDHHRSSHTGTSAFIPHDVLKRPRLVALATRLNMTAAQQATFTAAVIKESQGDSSKVSTSYATADRSRRKVVKQLADDSKEQWVAPDLATLHWDSKLMTALTDKNTSEERLCVVVGNTENLKLLGVPIYPSGDESSGNKIANLTCDLLISWHCAHSIVNMTFDTTASNTGHVSAACVTIQQRLCRERGIKLSSDFLKSARNETMNQNNLQVVENDRRRQPTLRKSN